MSTISATPINSERISRVQTILNALIAPLDTTYDPTWHWRSAEAQTRAVTANYVEEVADTAPLVDDLTKKTTFTADTIIMLWRKADDELMAFCEDIDEGENPFGVPWTHQQFAYGGVLHAFNNPAQMTPTVIPMLGVGEFRLVCANKAALLDQFKLYAKQWDSVLDKHSLVTRMAKSGEYVIDIVPKIVGKAVEAS